MIIRAKGKIEKCFTGYKCRYNNTNFIKSLKMCRENRLCAEGHLQIIKEAVSGIIVLCNDKSFFFKITNQKMKPRMSEQ